MSKKLRIREISNMLHEDNVNRLFKLGYLSALLSLCQLAAASTLESLLCICMQAACETPAQAGKLFLIISH